MKFRMSSMWSEKALLSAFRKGEEWAFAKLFERFRVPLTRYFASRTGSEEDAQDLAQEVFIKAFRFRESFDPSRGLETWIWTIARNTCVDWSRSRVAQPGAARAGESEASEIPCGAPTSEEILDRKIARRILLRGLRGLTASQRKVVWLRVFRQLSYEEISRKLGLSVSAVKCLATRARSALRQVGHAVI